MKEKHSCGSVNFGHVRPQPQIQDKLQGNDPEFSGFIVLRLTPRYNYRPGDDLLKFAKENKLELLYEFLETRKLTQAKRTIETKKLGQLREWEERAKNAELPPLRSLSAYWRIDARAQQEEIDKLVKELNRLPGVDYAYKEHMPSLPAVDPSDDTYAADQDYLEAAPTGVNALWAWTQTDCEGAGVGMIDCEWGWVTNHDDLSASSPTLIHNDNCYGSGGIFGSDWYDHGTAVLGEVVGTDNAIGVVGVAPSLDYVKMSSFYDAATDNHADTAAAIAAVIGEMNPGDIVLLEIQKGFMPTEIDEADFDAIRLIVANGIIVVEAAGNGNNDLDAWMDAGGNFRLNRSHADFEDSGAIMVGASVSAVVSGAHERWWASNYGSRIDCYAYGENVVTTGYGDLAGTSDTDNYTSSFGGTSGASPIIVGCAAILQGKYKATNGTILSPLQMRVILSDPATGTPQGATVAGNINVMPDLQAILTNTLGLVPDIYLRDYVGDDGIVPHGGSISSSPDIIVLPSPVADSTASFGEGSGNENSATLGSLVEAGQDNYIYVRMKNRGAALATGVTADVYWSEVATLITPDMWNLIGTTSPVNVPVGNTLVVTDGVTWDRNDIPGTGHYCFVGLLDTAQDPAPPIPPVAGFDWNDFRSFIRNHNNVTWRNFNVEDNLPDVPGPPAAYSFLITNGPDHRRKFDLQIFQRLPEDANLWFEFPRAEKGLFKGLQYLNIKENKETLRVQLPKLRCFQLNSVLLTAKARVKCRFLLEGSKYWKRGTHYFGIRQLWEAEEVGGITWALQPKQEESKRKK